MGPLDELSAVGVAVGVAGGVEEAGDELGAAGEAEARRRVGDACSQCAVGSDVEGVVGAFAGASAYGWVEGEVGFDGVGVAGEDVAEEVDEAYVEALGDAFGPGAGW